MQPAPQPAINTTQNRAAIFLVLGVKSGAAHAEQARRVCTGLDALQRAVGSRDSEGNLSCVIAFGSDAWDRLFGLPRPREKGFAFFSDPGNLEAITPPCSAFRNKIDHVLDSVRLPR